jgi:hypothetical protein
MGRLELGLELEVVGFKVKAVASLWETTNEKGYKIPEGG